MLSLKEELWDLGGECCLLRYMCSYEYILIGRLYYVVYVNMQVLWVKLYLEHNLFHSKQIQ